MQNQESYVSALRRRMAELKDEITQERLRVRELLEAISEKEEQLGHILKLLTAEGVDTEGESIESVLLMSVSDMAYEVMTQRAERKPMHYRELADLILAEGKLIPGRDPAANLISHLGRDDRFVRTGRGLYALAEWGLAPAKKPSKRRPTTRKSR